MRAAGNDPILIKRLLDMGAQTLMIPFVQSADEARAAVQAMRYGPRGVRGLAGMTRATRLRRVGVSLAQLSVETVGAKGFNETR